MRTPSVTVVVPARNEAQDIASSLTALLDQDHPHDLMEIVVVNGGSFDGTADVARGVLESGDVAWTIVDNPTGTTPSSLNRALAVASGEILCRVDARSIVPPDYVRLCSSLLMDRPDVVVTGGSQVARARDDSVRSVGIARALNNRIAMGGSRYRSGARSGPSDTVYLGAFRTADLHAVGGWDERFLTNQDFELNRRLGRRGTVWFDERLAVGYLPRAGLPDLWRQYVRFGRWKVAYWRLTGDRPRARQWVALAVPSLLGGVATAGLTLGGPRTQSGVVGAAVAGAVAVEHVGAPSSSASPAERAVAVVALSLTVGGWYGGVLMQLAKPKELVRTAHPDGGDEPSPRHAEELRPTPSGKHSPPR